MRSEGVFSAARTSAGAKPARSSHAVRRERRGLRVRLGSGVRLEEVKMALKLKNEERGTMMNARTRMPDCTAFAVLPPSSALSSRVWAAEQTVVCVTRKGTRLAEKMRGRW